MIFSLCALCIQLLCALVKTQGSQENVTQSLTLSGFMNEGKKNKSGYMNILKIIKIIRLLQPLLF